MHKYTQLIKEEMASKMSGEREDEWDSFAASWGSRGFPFPDGSLISGILEIGYKSIEKLINTLFEAEKTALSKEKSEPSEEYFGRLGEEFRSISQQEFATVRSVGLRYCQNSRGPIYNEIVVGVGHKEASIRESINRRVGILEQELKLGISSPSIHQNIQVTGDGAVINIGQVFGSINSTVKRFSGTGATELANALLHLAQGIKDSNIDEKEKLKQLENIEFLAGQREIPEAQRKKGPIKAVVQGLDRCLSTTASLATLWGQFGPMIMKAFGVE